MSKKVEFLSIFLEISKLGQHRVIFSTINTYNIFSAIQDKTKMFSENFCLANFSPILGHPKIVIFQNDVFGPSKILFLCYSPNFSHTRKIRQLPESYSIEEKKCKN